MKKAKKVSGKQKTVETAAEKFPPSAPEARDEGPRLIPLLEGDKHPSIERYLVLADIALGKRRK